MTGLLELIRNQNGVANTINTLTVDLTGTHGVVIVETDTQTGSPASGTTIQIVDELGNNYIPNGFAFPFGNGPTAVVILLGEASSWFSFGNDGSHGILNLLSPRRPGQITVTVAAAGVGVTTSIRVYSVRN